MVKVLVVLCVTTQFKPFTDAATVPVIEAIVTTSPSDRPCAELVKMVGLPAAIAVMVLAPPVPVAIWTIVPWALIAVEGMECS